MTILSIEDNLAAISLPKQQAVAVPSTAAQEKFAALLDGQSFAGTAAAFLVVQKEHAQKAVGVDLAAKVAGSFTQAINKLVSMQ
ncbi:hypothetical protein BLA50215_07908 [Burkholderia lata]|uniref:type III secretion system inner rod subunit SctI n=1 Tax=Burkholderia lata (strain ATCC 17760 / DSM 23089 / LMG 22485 / NCIMB 9086 / R18194 / 383) TaxID=482957 RepID=UPI001452FE1A|nr:type III secretion system inner rod subunit SctI [Burkholderia lata]VWD64755.1 hypothetical protein BLA50215_07908 [Burkholderia lata]